MNDLFVIPQSDNSLIAKIEDETIIEVGRINISYNSKNIITENKLIVSLCFESKKTIPNPTKRSYKS